MHKPVMQTSHFVMHERKNDGVHRNGVI